MASFITVMTDAGRALMTDLVEGHDSLDFVSMVVGDGEYTSEEKNINTLKARTSLKSLKETYAISLGEQTSAVDVRLVSNISNYDPSTGEPLFAEGFYVNEIGVMARPHSGGSSVLFAISVVLEEQGDFLPHYEGSNPVEMVQDILARVSNEASVSFNYSESAFALAEDLQETANDLSDHMETLVADQDGVHGIRYDIPNEKLYVTDPSTGDEVEVPTGGGGGGSVINVTTEDSEFYGQTVTLTDGHASLTGTFDNTGLCTFTGVTMSGTLTASVAYEGDTYSESVEVTYYGTYSIELSLGETFTLNITTPESTLALQDVVISNGTKSKTVQFNVAGQATAKIHFTGEVTLTSTDGTDTATKKITVVSGTSTYSVRMSFIQIWGAEWDGSSTQAWTRTDDAADFVDPTPAVNNGTGSSPFDDVDGPWAKMVRVTDSEAGECVKIPKFWFKWTQTGTGLKLQIADGEEDGFEVCPACANRDGTGERDYILYGRYHCSSSNYKSVTGVTPMVSKTRDQFRSSIHALGSTVWQADMAARETIFMLYLVEYANWDSQKTIGYGCAPDGSTSAVRAMGYTDAMGYHTGTTAANRTTYGGTQYRYIEGLWDNCYDWCDGIYFAAEKIYIILNPANFSDTSGGTYVGDRATAGGYIKSMKVSSVMKWLIYPDDCTGASEDTYVGDYCDYGASGVVLRVGGSCSQGRGRGLFCLYGGAAASHSYADIGSRLMKIPAAA